MLIDSTVLVAILLNEPEADFLVAKIEQCKTSVYYTAQSVLEAVQQLGAYEAQVSPHKSGRELAQAHSDVMDLLTIVKAKELPILASYHVIAAEALAKYGLPDKAEGFGVGESLTYACAKKNRIPVLIKGNRYLGTGLEFA